MVEKSKAYVQRTNPFRVSALITKITCACCGREVRWFDTVKVLEAPSDYKKGHTKDQRVCNRCCARVGIKHVADSGWMRLHEIYGHSDHR